VVAKSQKKENEKRCGLKSVEGRAGDGRKAPPSGEKGAKRVRFGRFRASREQTVSAASQPRVHNMDKRLAAPAQLCGGAPHADRLNFVRADQPFVPEARG
jgi:hypothetical protein